MGDLPCEAWVARDVVRPASNQITVVAFQSVQLAQASFLQKNIKKDIRVFKVDYFVKTKLVLTVQTERPQP